MQQFLVYVAKHSIEGRLDLVTEYHIGVAVFGRKDSYSTGEDNIVRSYARNLRKRLEEYFASEGADEEYVLNIPRGGYFLEFKKRQALTAIGVPNPVNPDPHSQDRAVILKPGSMERLALHSWSIRIGFCVVLLLLLIGSFALGRRSERKLTSSLSIHRFWLATLGERETVIVPSDTGLTVVLGLIQKDVTVQEYVAAQHLKELGIRFPQLEGWNRPISHRYTDLVDVLAIRQFDQTPEVAALKPRILYARDLTYNELKSGNAIMLGGSNANPWVQLFDKDLDFHLHFVPVGRTFRVENRHPLEGEPSEYPYANGAAQPYAYGLVAIVPNASHTGNVLLLEGVTNAGLQAAASMLADESLMSNVVQKAVRSDGTIRSSEFLVRTTGVGGDSTDLEIVGSRVHP